MAEEQSYTIPWDMTARWGYLSDLDLETDQTFVCFVVILEEI